MLGAEATKLDEKTRFNEGIVILNNANFGPSVGKKETSQEDESGDDEDEQYDTEYWREGGKA